MIHKGTVKLETGRLILRSYSQSDLRDYHKLMSDAKNMYFLDDIATATLAQSQESLTETIRLNAYGKVMRLCVALKENNALIGGVGYDITQETPVGKIGHMGWFIMPEFRNCGYITEAAKKMLEYAFTQDNCVRITTACYKDNAPTQKVMIKAGFKQEAEKIKCAWHDGILKDRLEFAILAEDYFSPPQVNITITPYSAQYRDDMLFCFMCAKDAMGRAHIGEKPCIKPDLLDIEGVYLKRGDIFLLALDENDRVVGMVGTETVSPTEMWLKRLFIKPELKGKGIGSKLLAEVEKFAVSRGVTALHTRFADWYTAAARFYPAKGFVDAEPSKGLRHMVKYFG